MTSVAHYPCFYFIGVRSLRQYIKLILPLQVAYTLMPFIPFNYSDASGHVAIVIGTGVTVGANAEVVHKAQFGFNTELSHGQPIVFRRYVEK